MTDIDDTDYALLAAIADAEKPLWKKRLHNRLQNRSPPLPGNTDLSLQSVGRRVNLLHERGLVDTEIVHPPNIAQNLIIGYTLTDNGRQVLKEKRSDIIGSYARWTSQDMASFGDRETLLQLLQDELKLSEEEHEILQSCEMDELLVFTLLYHTRRLVNSTLNEQTAAAFYDILERHQKHGNDNDHMTKSIT